jgi:RNA polymerase sigma-70 factor (ECF subfamily)
MSNTLNPDNWIGLYGDYLYGLAMMKTGNTQIAEDMVQDTLLSAFKARDQFKGNSSEKTWLAVILKNKIIDYYRKKDVLKNTTDYLAETEESFHQSFFSSDNGGGHWTADTAPKEWQTDNADNILNKHEFYRILQYCIQKMPSRLVPIFIARFVDEDDAEKICKEFNITSSNYWVIIHRAKLLMRSCLEKNWFSA